jgi:hypothetical protein
MLEMGVYKALSQMLLTLMRLDKLAALKAVLTLRGMLTGTTTSYTARVLAGEQPQIEAAAAAAALADDEEDDDGTVHVPKSLSDIELAPTPRVSSLLLSFYLSSYCPSQSADILKQLKPWQSTFISRVSPTSCGASCTRNSMVRMTMLPLFRSTHVQFLPDE